MKKISSISLIFTLLFFICLSSGAKINKSKNNQLDTDFKLTTILPYNAPTIQKLRSCSDGSNATIYAKEFQTLIQCQPKDVVVEISHLSGFKITPNAVLMKQCIGACTGGKKCVPSKKHPRRFNVNIKGYDNSTTCNILIMLEPVECKCRCLSMKKKQCLPQVQKFDKKRCRCVCVNAKDQEACFNKSDFNMKWTWDEKTCSCICQPKPPCTTGTTWDKAKCRCVPQEIQN